MYFAGKKILLFRIIPEWEISNELKGIIIHLVNCGIHFHSL
jgi:hypothetical protein